MNLDAPKNANYAACVIRVGTILDDLPGLDNLVGVPVLGGIALTQRGISVGDLRVAFTAETALSEEYACESNLFRDATRNKDGDQVGYLERNARIRAIRLRGNVSNALLMPLESLSYAGINPNELREGDTFDTINGHEVCRKYVIPLKVQRHQSKSKIEKLFRRVDAKHLPEHLDTAAYWRNKHELKPHREVIVTQKLHGSSIRVGRVPALRKKRRLERFANRVLRIATPDYRYEVVAGSRKVIKDPELVQNHYYSSDIWHEYGQKIGDLIPEGVIIYGELIGFCPDGTPLQKNYTYDAEPNEMELYVYRVANVNSQGHLSDLSWDGVKEFCTSRGLKYVPELHRIGAGIDLQERVEEFIDHVMDKRIWDEVEYPGWIPGPLPLPLSDPKTVDEGVCLRQEGVIPQVWKAKSARFLEHETKLLDKGEADIESMESAA